MLTNAVCEHLVVRVLLSSTTFEKGAWEGNLASHLDALRRGADAGCDLVAFPELSLTGSVDPVTHPEHAIALDHQVVRELVAATHATPTHALFGVAERDRQHDTQHDREHDREHDRQHEADFFITQVCAADGRIVAVQRKRHLGDDEEAFALGRSTAVFPCAGTDCGVIICAESGVDFTWDATAAAGAQIVFFCAAPGLTGRRRDEAAWRDGFAWWERAGLGDACHHAARLGLWVAMVTQAGATIDEDFPGIAAIIGPDGKVRDRLPDWRPGVLLGDVMLDLPG